MHNQSYEQTWLSLSGICDRLRLSPVQIRQLVKKGCLAVLKGKSNVEARYLDPSPEYAEQIRLGAIIHQKVYPVSPGINEKALLTSAECAEILGMTQKKMSIYIKRHAIPAIRVSKVLFLYSPAFVREAMLRRSKRSLSKQLAPFKIEELITMFRDRLSAEVSLIPTDAEFAADEKLQLRLSKIVTESQKADFAQKVKLAQDVVNLLGISLATSTNKITDESAK
jgi:hypothetical protein